jgi:Cu/Ag efflux protein CusF
MTKKETMNAEGLYLNIRTVVVILVVVIGFTAGVMGYVTPLSSAAKEREKIESRIDKIDDKLDKVILHLARIGVVSLSDFNIKPEDHL